MTDNLSIYPHLRYKLVQELSSIPRVISKVVTMMVYMRLYGNKKEVKVFYHQVESDDLFQRAGGGGKVPQYILHSPLLHIFGRGLLTSVEKVLEKKRVQYCREDVLLLSFLVVSAIVRGKSSIIFPPQPSGAS